MSYESAIHGAQSLILRHLLFVRGAGFTQLQKKTNLSSDHFTFHLKKLIENGFVEKEDNEYILTRRGKEYANRMDTDENELEKQPKISVVLIVERNHNGNREFICQQRLKQPYFGFWGRLGGKVRWGESFEDAASRELKEETGLNATFTFKSIFRKRDYDTQHQLLEDKVFVVMHTDNATGQLMADFEGGHNEWLTQEEFIKKDKFFESARDFISYLDTGISYHTQEYTYSKSEY